MTTLRNLEVLGRSGTFDIEIDGGAIHNISPNGGGPNGIVFEDALAFPGLINSHDHLEFDCYDQPDGGPYADYLEWAAAVRLRHSATIAAVEAVPKTLRTQLGIAKNLLCGVTSVAHHGPDPQQMNAPITIIEGTRSIHSPRLDGLRGMLVPDRRTVVAHVGEGLNRNSEKEIDTLIRRNIWGKRLIGVHAIAMRTDQAKRFAAIVWCPVSNEFLFRRTSPIALLKRHTTILFGTDSTISASWNIWDQIRRAREIGALTDDELIASLTSKAAEIWNLADRGKIQAGAAADIVIVRKQHADQREAFFAVKPEDILLVMAKGAIVLLDASLRIQVPEGVRLFPTIVNGAEKLTSEDYGKLAASLRTLLPAIPVPIGANAVRT